MPPQLLPTPAAAPPPPPTPSATPATWDDIVTGYAKKYQIDPRVAKWIAQTESSMNPAAVSPAGARGIMQLMPATAARHNVNPDDPADNIRGGLAEFRQLLDANNNDVITALRQYNASPQAPREATDPYVQKFMREIAGSSSTPRPSADTLAPPSQIAAPPPAPPPTRRPGDVRIPPPFTALQKAESIGPAPPPPWYESFSDEATKSLRMIPEALHGANALIQQGFWHPIESAKAVNAGIQQGFWHPGQTYDKFFGDITDKVKQAWAANDLARAALEAKNIPLNVIPGLGTRMSEAEQYMREGEYAKGLGATADIAGQIALPEVAAKGVPLVPRVFKPRLTPPQAAAVQLGKDTGIMDVATASQSRFARNIQAGTEATPLGSVAATVAQAQRQQKLPELGESLASKVHPTVVRDAEAGAGLQSGVADFATAKQAEASVHYDLVERIANDPIHTQQVPTHTTNAWTPQGTLTQVPVLETVQAPVDLRNVKAALTPIRDQIKQQMTLGKQQYSEGLLALDNLLALRDFEPVTIVERNLGAVKRVARKGDAHFKTLETGTAGLAVGELSDAVDATMAQLGPQAQASLAQARAAAKAKWAVEDLFDTLDAKSPVGAFRVATAAGDVNAPALVELARVAPQEMPRVGRAVLENIFEKARGLEQGWSRADTVANMWERLGPQTKQLLFGNRTDDLNHFFLLQKMLAQQANPTRTALVGTSLASVTGAIISPFWGGLAVLGSGGVAALMHSKAGVQLMTQGLRIPPNSAQASAWLATAARLIEEAKRQGAGTPPPAPPQ